MVIKGKRSDFKSKDWGSNLPGLGLGEFPTQKKASGPVPSYAKFLIKRVDSSTA